MSSALRAVANTRQPRAFRVSAAQSPMPDEQPVMRIDRLGIRSTVNVRLSCFPQAEGPSGGSAPGNNR